MEMAVQAGIVVLILGVAYAVISEGLWGAALVFLNLLFSSLLALNFYEPVATLIVNNAGALGSFADMFALGGIWALAFFLLKLATDNMAPTLVRFPPLVGQIARLVFGLGSGVLTAGMVLLILQVAPVHKKLFNAVDPAAEPPYGMGLTDKTLGFFKYTCENTFPASWSMSKEPNPNIFPEPGTWISTHTAARPHGELDTPAAAPPAAAGGGGNPGGNS